MNEEIKKAQDKAKEIGHCLCNMVITCPCNTYKETGKCRCSGN